MDTYRVIAWRYGTKYEHEIEAKDRGEAWREYNRMRESDEHFVEHLIGPDGTVLTDNKENVIGIGIPKI